MNKLLGNEKLWRLLSYFLENPSAENSYTQLLSKTQLSRATLGKWLNYLSKTSFLQAKSIGTSKLYRLQTDYFLVKELKKILNLSKLEFMVSLAEKKHFKTYLYGSCARGEDHEKSDIDLLIVGTVKKEEIISEIKKQEKKLKKDIRIQIFNLLEWSSLKEKDPAFYERVEKDKVLIQ